MSRIFPFTAVVGQEMMQQALLFNAVHPLIGGVLIRGEKGTAKSTLVRALADVLPEVRVAQGCPLQCDPDAPFEDCPWCRSANARTAAVRRMPVVTLPAGATEERVVGSLDIEHALKTGERRFEPGLLAQAHRGILYIDEVNLLDDHLIDLLLDAAAMGVNTVEREGVSFSHPARFILIGTMNPEEGDVRPQLLDRFGLCVEAQAIMDPALRAEIVKRRIAWERDPAAFAAGFSDPQQRLAEALVAARDLLPRITVPEPLYTQAASVCAQLDIRSHRADIVMIRTAMASAAFAGRLEPTTEDLETAALLALPHRARRTPFQENTLDPERISQACADAAGDRQQPAPESEPAGKAREEVFEISIQPQQPLPEHQKRSRGVHAAQRKSKTSALSRRGRYTRAAVPESGTNQSGIAVDATLRASVLRRSKGSEIPGLTPDDLRIKQRAHAAGTTVLFIVDASGSMAAARRMAAAKGAVLSLLQSAYVERSRVALIAFWGNRADVLLPPTNNVAATHEKLKELPTGGRTPLAHGLARALELTRQIKRRHAGTRCVAVLLSDGRANVSYADGTQTSPFDEAVAFARELMQIGSELLVLDTEDEFLAIGNAARLAQAAGAAYRKLSRIEADEVADAVRERIPPTHHDPAAIIRQTF